jgi:hypothetical protein
LPFPPRGSFSSSIELTAWCEAMSSRILLRTFLV